MLEQTLGLGGGLGSGALGGSGQWGEVRSAIAAEFRPSAALITTEPKPAAVAKQLTQGAPMRSAPPAMVAAVSEPTGELDPVGQADAARRSYERPVNVRTVELAAVIEADGRVASVDVLAPSGNVAFDDAAIVAVRSGVRERLGPGNGPELPGQPAGQRSRRVVLRLRVSAGRAVTLPRVVPVREPPQQNSRRGSQGLIGSGSFQFDETTGAVQAERPFDNRLSSQVELISVTPAPPPAPTPAPVRPAAP